MKPEDLFARIGASLNSSNASQKEFNAANDIFGTRIGPRLMAMLREIQGSAGLDGYIAKAREAGAVVAEETVRMADAFDSLSQRGILKLKALAASGLGALVEKMKGYNPMWGRLYEAVTPPAPATQGAAGARFTGEPIAPTVPDPAGAQRSAVVRAMERQAAARQAFDATIKTSGFSRDSYDKVGGQIGGASRADMVSVGQAQLRALNEANELARELIAAIESNNNNGGQL
jgi:hypothetical protein